jgi:hypothetical protein
MFVTASHAQSVQTDFDKSYDFSKLKTFNFAIQKRTPNDPLAQDSLNDGRIRNAIESKLTANGFKIENAEKPDFAVAYYVTTKNKFDVRDYGYGPPRWFGSRDIRVDQYTEGTLTVDIIDVATKQLVWRGRASGTIELKNIDKKINKAVEKLVKQFVKDKNKKG